MRPVPINDPEVVIEAFLDSEIALTTGVMRVDTERSDSGEISYVYNDPIAEKRVAGRTRIREKVAGITIGRLAGDSKLNPKTGDFFPAIYSFDPFAGAGSSGFRKNSTKIL